MAFGSARVQAKTFTDSNGGSGKDVFVVSKAGDKGAEVSVMFHMFHDTPEREETEVIAKEVGLKVKVRGQEDHRTCLVRNDNPHDAMIWEQVNELKTREDLSEKDLKELRGELLKKLARYVFYINVYVYNEDGTGKVQVLKGSWEEVREDENGNLTFWRNGKINEYGGKTEYGILRKKIKSGARLQDPKKPLKAIIVNDIKSLILTRSISGMKLAKRYEYTASGVSELSKDVLSLPRYDLAAWAGNSGTGIWPNEAILELMNGADFYETREKYGVVLYPEKPELEEVAEDALTVTDSEEDEDSLFSE